MHPGWIVVAVVGGVVAVARLFREDEIGPQRIFDCSGAFNDFYTNWVRLSAAQQAKLREHRDANRRRIEEGLCALGGPQPLEFIVQGSHAMDTINQEPDNAYDIDDGVVFDIGALVGSRGGLFSALDARKLVHDCVDDPRLNERPELRPNCVRVHYAGGYHVDVPVYRCYSNGSLEHAGSDWHDGDPRGVNKWFQNAVNEHSPDTDNGQQLRRIVRLLKKIGTSRSSWNMPPGFVLTKLAVECYEPALNRDDASMYLTIRKIRSRLDDDLTVKHPVVDEMLTRRSRDASMVCLCDKLGELLDKLAIITKNNCTHRKAISAWRHVFNNSYFTEP